MSLPSLLYRTTVGALRKRAIGARAQRVQRDPLGVARQSLQSILSYAGQRVSFYRAQTHGGELPIEGLAPLTKTIIRDHFAELRADHVPTGSWIENSSGGSTGQPQTFLQNREFAAWNGLTKAYYFRTFHDIDEDAVAKLVFWGSERDLMHGQSIAVRAQRWLTQTTFFNTFRLTDRDLERAVAALNEVRPHFVKGYASSLYAVAKFVLTRGGLRYQPKFVYSSAETLQPFMRDAIERAFGAKVFNYYGSREAGAIAGECRAGNLHIFAFNTHVEVVDDSLQPVAAEQEGRLLISTLHNTVMPLLRYEIGDAAVRGGPCACGNPLPTLARISGRLTDNFTTAKGDVVHGEYFTHLFYHRDWVNEFQVLQDELRHISVFLVLRPSVKLPDHDRQSIERDIRLVMGQDCMIDWRFVDAVPRTPQGKLLFTRSLIHDHERT